MYHQSIANTGNKMATWLRAGRVAGLFLTAFLAACQGPLEPGDTLSGHWSSPDAAFDASSQAMVFTARCERAEFGPVVLDANRNFQAESTVFTETGNAIHSPGDRLRIQGYFAGNQLMLQLVVIRTLPPVSDPVLITLAPGKARTPLVCSA